MSKLNDAARRLRALRDSKVGLPYSIAVREIYGIPCYRLREQDMAVAADRELLADSFLEEMR